MSEETDFQLAEGLAELEGGSLSDDLGDLADDLGADDDPEAEAPAPMDDVAVPASLGDFVPPDEAVENLGDTHEGAELVSMWGSDAPRNINIAQNEAAQIVADIERHDPGAAAVLLDVVYNKMSDAQQTAVIAALAKRGR